MRHALVRIAVGLGLVGLFAVASPAVVAAQTGKLTGVVRDQATNNPLDGVEIFIEGTGITTFTAANGRFFLLSLAPGNYTLVARRLGYQPVRTPGVTVTIDVTREVNFGLQPAQGPQTLEALTVEATAVPLVEPGVSSSTVGISGDVIRALPVVTIEGALKLQQGFLQVPDNTDIISYTASRRDATNPVRIRGGRAGETLTLIDGIPVNNWIFGGPAISITPEAVQQLEYVKGGMEPQYGNALSGIINIATRDGGTNLAGSVRYQTSDVGGWMGNRSDELRDYSLLDGYISGPVPATNNKLRFMIAGRQSRGADAVHEFDDDVHDPSCTQITNPASCTVAVAPLLGANWMDVWPGWRAFGFSNLREVFGKLTYFFTPSMKLGVSYIDQQQQRQPFDFVYLLTYGNPLESPIIDNLADSVALIGNRAGSRVGTLEFTRVVEGSIDAARRLGVARLDHTLGRTAYHLAFGLFQLDRNTCNFWQGVCLGDNFADPNFTDDNFISPLAGTCAIHPTCGADYFSGGEDLTSQIFRGDIESQVTDHHNVRGGLLYLRHDVELDLVENIGGNNVIKYPQQYSAKPWDVAFYVQDKIEYDFLTVKLGVRFDLGQAGGRFWVNPLDPTNGTQADDVCATPSDWQNRTVRVFDQTSGTARDSVVSADPAWSSLGPACGGDEAILKEAAVIATADDFGKSKRRRQFSPRIGVSFPLGQASAVFFNFGRNTQNPLLNNLFVATGIGTPAEGTVAGPTILLPDGGSSNYIGNSNLLTEQTTSYELGYAAELGEDYAVGFTLFSKDQLGLTGFRTGGIVNGVQVFDPGVTYGSNQPSYRVLVNQDFQTVRGLELSLRRRVANHWGFDVNFSVAEARTNAADPEKEFERQVGQFDPRLNAEVASDIDQPTTFNSSLIFQWGTDVPSGTWGSLLRHLSTSLVFRAQSGLPYTPTLDFYGFTGSQLIRNSGRGPATYQLDWSLSKDFTISNLRYGFTAQVLNVTDRKNCIQVYETTGQCTVGSVDASRRREGNPVAADEITSTYLDRAQYYGARRSVQAGLRVSF
ncbi:MAG: TonB-dependent receptor [Gemmatimonadetes bacterium]|nr:TonB-dependent receptor [Gemmatimonadota bacterium]